MFLVQLYRYHKLLFVLFVGWLVAFVFLNVKWGMVASPVYQYGMFSRPMDISEPRPAYRIMINNERLNPVEYSFAQRDILYVSLDKYRWQSAQNAKVFQALKKFLPVHQDTHPYFSNAISQQEIAAWYRQRVSEITRRTVHSLEVYHEYWLWNEGALILQSSEKLSYFD